jgi:plasmid stabilization system protein ParE
MRVELLRGAEADLLEVYVRLEDGRPGLGERFYRTLDLALERLRQHPEIAPLYRGAYRRLVLQPLGWVFSMQLKPIGSWWAPSSIFGKAPSRFNAASRTERRRTPLRSRFGRGAETRTRGARAPRIFEEKVHAARRFSLTHRGMRLICSFRYHADSGVPGVFFSSARSTSLRATLVSIVG